MVTNEQLINIIKQVESYIISEEYKGYDPFDGLNSPIFRYSIFNRSKIIRLLFQQILKRLPFNIRPILGIKKEINPTTLGIVIQAYSYLMELFPQEKNDYLFKINKLITLLEMYKSTGYSGYCWGCNFDWEARYANIPKYVPSIVVTSIIINGLFEYYKITGDDKVKEIITSSSKFVLRDLNRYYEGDKYCFSYSPNDHQIIFNATTKAARLLSQVYTITKDKSLLRDIEQTVLFVVNNQNIDGSWSYSKGDSRKWIDHFHTAYILDALDEVINNCGVNQYRQYLDKGISFYLDKLFTKNGIPKYYDNSFYPIDSTCLAQSIITLTRFNMLERAFKVIEFAINNLYSGRGWFYYRKKMITNKISYMRWSNAWFLLALSSYIWRISNV